MSDGLTRAQVDLVKELTADVERLTAANTVMLAALNPLSAIADNFQWVIEKGLDQEGVFVWSEGGSHAGKSITVGDVFRARAVVRKAEGKPEQTAPTSQPKEGERCT